MLLPHSPFSSCSSQLLLSVLGVTSSLGNPSLGSPTSPKPPRSSPKAVPESHSGGSQRLPAFPVRAQVCLCCQGGSGRAQTPFGGSLEGLQEVRGPWPCPGARPVCGVSPGAQGWSRRWFPVHCGVCGESREWTKLEDPGECLDRRQQLPGPSFYLRDTKSGRILCVVGFSCPAAPPGGPGAPLGMGLQGRLCFPPSPQAPHPHIPHRQCLEPSANPGKDGKWGSGKAAEVVGEEQGAS